MCVKGTGYNRHGVCARISVSIPNHIYIRKRCVTNKNSGYVSYMAAQRCKKKEQNRRMEERMHSNNVHSCFVAADSTRLVYSSMM